MSIEDDLLIFSDRLNIALINNKYPEKDALIKVKEYLNSMIENSNPEKADYNSLINVKNIYEDIIKEK